MIPFLAFFKTVFYVQFKQGNEIFPNLNHAKKTSGVLLVYKFFFIYQLNDFRRVFRFSGDVTYMHNVAHFNGQLCLNRMSYQKDYVPKHVLQI